MSNSMNPMNWTAVASAIALALWSAVAFAADDTVLQVAPLDSLDELANVSGELTVVNQGPDGEPVLHAERGFSFRLPLKQRGIDPRGYDLVKLQIKTDPRARIRVSVENYPNPGDICHWYALHGSEGEIPWRTLWIDLNRPEELKVAGAYKGMSEEELGRAGIAVDGGIIETDRSIQDPGRSMWIDNLRLVRRVVEIDWDQTKAPYTWGEGQDLVYTYPIEVTNTHDQPIEVELELLPVDVTHASASFSQPVVSLAPGETRTVEARVSLPAAVAAKAAPLYAERFEPRARARGIPDSEVPILRSSNALYLPVVVPIPEEQLRFPLMGHLRDLPDYVVGFDPETSGTGGRNSVPATELVERASADDIDTAVDGGGLEARAHWIVTLNAARPDDQQITRTDEHQAAAGRWMNGLTAAAYLYDFTGEQKYLDKARAMLLAVAQRWPVEQAKYDARDFKLISEGLITDNTLHLGFRTAGTTRPPYQWEHLRHGAINDFDVIAADLDESTRRKIIEGFILPAAIQMRNHYIGLGNQQSTVNYGILYAGLVARNWPLVAFVHSGDYGVQGQIAWTFDDDGLCLESHYQAYTICPTLWATELLYHMGIDLYDKRLYTIVHSPAAEAINEGFHYPIVRYLDEHRFAGKPFAGKPLVTTDGYHLAALTLLKWDGMEVSMNWGTAMQRGNHDRMTLTVRGNKLDIGGDWRSHSSWAQSTINIDEQHQEAIAADVLSVDVDGPVQHIQARSNQQFPGSTITRTFALLDKHVLVIDRVENDQPRLVDWQLRATRPAESLSLAQREGTYTDRKDQPENHVAYGEQVDGHRIGTVNDTWRSEDGKLTVLGEKDTRLIAFNMPGRGNRSGPPVLIARREGVSQTDYVAIVSHNTKSIQRIPAKTAAGADADAVAVRVTLDDGRTFHALVNYEPQETKVTAGPLTTTERFATDYQP